MDAKFSTAETFRKKMGQWVVRQMKKCRQLLSSDKVDDLPTNREQLKAAFTHFVDIMMQQSDDDVVGEPETIEDESLTKVAKKIRLVKTQQELNDLEEEF